jgi:hypothetical protein
MRFDLSILHQRRPRRIAWLNSAAHEKAPPMGAGPMLSMVTAITAPAAAASRGLIERAL